MDPTNHIPSLEEPLDRAREIMQRNPNLGGAVRSGVLALAKKIMLSKPPFRDKADETIYLLTQAALQDYQEIFLLSVLGHGDGAVMILRSLFEKVVTAGYIAQKPEVVGDFLDYGIVQVRKFITTVPSVRNRIPDDKLETFDAALANIGDKFRRSKCDCCGITKPLSWSALDLVSMAKKVGYKLPENLPWGYYRPRLSKLVFTDKQARSW